MIMYTNQQILVDHTETCVHVYFYNVSVATTVNEQYRANVVESVCGR